MYVESISRISGYCSTSDPIGEKQVPRTRHNPFIQERFRGRSILVPVQYSVAWYVGSRSHTQVMLQPHCTIDYVAASAFKSAYQRDHLYVSLVPRVVRDALTEGRRSLLAGSLQNSLLMFRTSPTKMSWSIDLPCLITGSPLEGNRRMYQCWKNSCRLLQAPM